MDDHLGTWHICAHFRGFGFSLETLDNRGLPCEVSLSSTTAVGQLRWTLAALPASAAWEIPVTK